MAENDDPFAIAESTAPERASLLGKLKGLLTPVLDQFAGLTGSVPKETVRLAALGIAVIAGIVVLVVVISALSTVVDSYNQNQITIEKQQEEKKDVIPFEFSLLVLPPMFERLEQGFYTTPFPPRLNWSLHEWRAYLPSFREFYLKTLRERNNRDFQALLSAFK